MNENDIIYRLRKRAEIRRQIPTRKSVQEGTPDRIADLLEEAATALEQRDKIIESLMMGNLHKPNYIPSTFDTTEGCYVCGLGANGTSTGYVCYNEKCPTRITC